VLWLRRTGGNDDSLQGLSNAALEGTLKDWLVRPRRPRGNVIQYVRRLVISLPPHHNILRLYGHSTSFWYVISHRVLYITY